MGSRPAHHRYCRCGTRLAADNSEHQCARCQRASRDKLIAPPQVPAEFWRTERFRQAFAALGDSSACTAALSQARTQVDQLKPDDDPLWLYWLDPTSITISSGACLLQLGQADQAATVLTEGIAQFSEPFVRDRQICITRLAETLDATRGADLLRDLYHQLRPHSEVPAVRDFLERARGFAA